MLREPVIVRTGTGPDLHGELFVGADGLPELDVEIKVGYDTHEIYSPHTIPAAWTIQWVPSLNNTLIDGWRTIERVRQQIRDAQREAEAASRPCEDCGEPNPCGCIEALPDITCAPIQEIDDIDRYKADADARGER